MVYKPIWTIKTKPTDFPSLHEDLSVDVAIVGGGITGITAAYLLQKKDLNIAVLESQKIGKGTSGQSTGNLYALTEYPFHKLKNKYDQETIQKVIQSRNSTIDFMEENISELNIDCDFERRPMYIFENDDSVQTQKEEEIVNNTELEFSTLPDDFPLPYNKGLQYKNQAQINPLKYVQELAFHAQKKNCSLYEHSRVHEIEEEADFITLKTDQAKVKAKKVIYATHTPLGKQLRYQVYMDPYREYGIAAKLKDNAYPKGIFWGHFDQNKFSVRTYTPDNDSYLICVGGMHQVGKVDDNQNNINNIKEFMNTYFDVQEFTHQWGGQNYKSGDMLPYIGRRREGSNQFVATGFSTDGLVYGSLAAEILSKEITGETNKYSAFYKSSRQEQEERTPVNDLDKTGKPVPETIKDKIKERTHDLQADQGKIIEVDEEKYAIYKNPEGKLKILPSICPHMGCTVQWNVAEKSWDCPCHASRFNTNGSVIEGPVLKPLQ